ncbi:hypothetical protein OG21DRAFT_1509338, partial [Imleria badia]
DRLLFVWVCWVIGAREWTYWRAGAGPYDTLREWADPTQVKHPVSSPTTSTATALPDTQAASSVTPVAVPTTNLPTVKVFTGPTHHAKDLNDYTVPDGCLHVEDFGEQRPTLKPISPYFLQEEGSMAFKKWIHKLYQYFKHQDTPHDEKEDHPQEVHQHFERDASCHQSQQATVRHPMYYCISTNYKTRLAGKLEDRAIGTSLKWLCPSEVY